MAHKSQNSYWQTSKLEGFLVSQLRKLLFSIVVLSPILFVLQKKRTAKEGSTKLLSGHKSLKRET